jgi:hypothetical protein
MALLRFPQVLFAFAVDQLRRMPGVQLVERHASVAATVLFAAAVLVFASFLAQRSPQRVTMADLAQGNVSSLQSWIIVSGELAQTSAGTGTGFRYNLTDPRVPDAVLIVFSPGQLSEGPTTISGNLVGGRSPAQAGFGWVGQLRADAVVAQEPDPPWLAAGLAGLGALVIVASRSAYPVFIGETWSVPAHSARIGRAIQVLARTDEAGAHGGLVPATLVTSENRPAELTMPGIGAIRVRLHSARTGIEVGHMRSLRRSRPAIVVRPTIGEVCICFSSTGERDAAVAALVADAEGRAAP